MSMEKYKGGLFSDDEGEPEEFDDPREEQKKNTNQVFSVISGDEEDQSAPVDSQDNNLKSQDEDEDGFSH